MHPDTRYALMRHHPSGEAYAIRYLDNGAGTITGVCGPLYYSEQSAPGPDYHYDDQLEDVEWAQEIGTDARPNESLEFVRGL